MVAQLAEPVPELRVTVDRFGRRLDLHQMNPAFERHLIGSFDYCLASYRRDGYFFSPERDMKTHYRALLSMRVAIGDIAAPEVSELPKAKRANESTTGKQLETKVVNVLELEYALTQLSDAVRRTWELCVVGRGLRVDDTTGQNEYIVLPQGPLSQEEAAALLSINGGAVRKRIHDGVTFLEAFIYDEVAVARERYATEQEATRGLRPVGIYDNE